MRNYREAFAILRIDRLPADRALSAAELVEGHVTVKSIVWTAEKAKSEVDRLNALVAERRQTDDTWTQIYYSTPTRVEEQPPAPVNDLNPHKDPGGISTGLPALDHCINAFGYPKGRITVIDFADDSLGMRGVQDILLDKLRITCDPTIVHIDVHMVGGRAVYNFGPILDPKHPKAIVAYLQPIPNGVPDGGKWLQLSNWASRKDFPVILFVTAPTVKAAKFTAHLRLSVKHHPEGATVNVVKNTIGARLGYGVTLNTRTGEATPYIIPEVSSQT